MTHFNWFLFFTKKLSLWFLHQCHLTPSPDRTNGSATSFRALLLYCLQYTQTQHQATWGRSAAHARRRNVRLYNTCSFITSSTVTTRHGASLSAHYIQYKDGDAQTYLGSLGGTRKKEERKTDVIVPHSRSGADERSHSVLPNSTGLSLSLSLELVSRARTSTNSSSCHRHRESA